MKELVHDVHRQPDGLGLVREGALDGLFDPPGAVGGKLGPFGGVKPFHGLHQAHVPLVDQIEQGHAVILVLAGNLDHEPQVGLDHPLARLAVALLDPGGQMIFLLDGQQRRLANLAQIEVERGVAIVRQPFRRLNREGFRQNHGPGRRCSRGLFQIKDRRDESGARIFAGGNAVPTPAVETQRGDPFDGFSLSHKVFHDFEMVVEFQNAVARVFWRSRTSCWRSAHSRAPVSFSSTNTGKNRSGYGVDHARASASVTACRTRRSGARPLISGVRLCSEPVFKHLRFCGDVMTAGGQ